MKRWKSNRLRGGLLYVSPSFTSYWPWHGQVTSYFWAAIFHHKIRGLELDGFCVFTLSDNLRYLQRFVCANSKYANIKYVWTSTLGAENDFLKNLCRVFKNSKSWIIFEKGEGPHSIVLAKPKKNVVVFWASEECFHFYVMKWTVNTWQFEHYIMFIILNMLSFTEFKKQDYFFLISHAAYNFDNGSPTTLTFSWFHIIWNHVIWPPPSSC